MLKFQKIVKQVRSLTEGETDVEIMQKLIEHVMDDINEIGGK